MKTICILLLISSHLHTFGQEWQQTAPEQLKGLLEKNASRFREENYVLSFQNSVYKDIHSGEPAAIEQSGTIIRGKGKQYRSEQGEHIILQNAEVKLLIDTANHIVGVMNPDTLFDALQTDQLLQHVGWEKLTCETKKGKGKTLFRLAGDGLQAYEHIELTFADETGELSSMVLLFKAYNYFSERPDDATNEQPRITINYSPVERLSDADRVLLEMSGWVSRTSKNTYELSTSKSNYRLEDYRITTTH